MNIFGQLKEKLTEYVDVYVRLFKINFIGRTANLLSYFMFAMICMLIVFLYYALLWLWASRIIYCTWGAETGLLLYYSGCIPADLNNSNSLHKEAHKVFFLRAP